MNLKIINFSKDFKIWIIYLRIDGTEVSRTSNIFTKKRTILLLEKMSNISWNYNILLRVVNMDAILY